MPRKRGKWNDLLQGIEIDSRAAAELLQVFLIQRGNGAPPVTVLDAVDMDAVPEIWHRDCTMHRQRDISEAGMTGDCN